MEINSTSSVNGVNAYAANTLDSQRNQVENQNQASARSDVSPRDAQTAQQAFEVNISQEARQLSSESGARTDQQISQAQSAEDSTQSAQRPQETPPPGNDLPTQGQGQAAAARQQASQIVNIVA